MATSKQQLEQLLREAGLTPENVARAKKALASAGPLQLAKSVQEYQQTLHAFRRGEVSAITLASAYQRMIDAAELSAQQTASVVSRSVTLIRSALESRKRS